MAPATVARAMPPSDAPEGGIPAIHWGDARLEPDRTFTWVYSEQLPVAPQLPEWQPWRV